MKHTPRILKHAQAKQDLTELFGYLLERNEHASRLFLAEARKAFDLILQVPGIGRRWDSPDCVIKNLRVTTLSRRFHDYLIFYRTVAEGVQIVTVIHGARDLAPLVDALPDDLPIDPV